MKKERPDHLVLMSSRERVERFLKLGGVVAGLGTGMVAAGMVSPVLLGVMSGFLLVSGVILREGMLGAIEEFELEAQLASCRYRRPAWEGCKKRVGPLARVLGLDKLPELVIDSRPRDNAGGCFLRVGGRSFIVVSSFALRLRSPSSRTWVVTHEMAHAARRDDRMILGNAARNYGRVLCYLLVGSRSSWRSRVVQTITQPLQALWNVKRKKKSVGFTVARNPDVPGTYTIRGSLSASLRQDEPRPKISVPLHEKEAERVTATLLSRSCTPEGGYSYDLSSIDMANHCAAYDIPPPAHLPPPTELPGLVTRTWNGMCRLVVKPLVVPLPKPAPRHSVLT